MEKAIQHLIEVRKSIRAWYDHHRAKGNLQQVARCSAQLDILADMISDLQEMKDWTVKVVFPPNHSD